MSRVKRNPIEKRMKELESKVCHEVLPSRKPFIIRLDGANFTKYTSELFDSHNDPMLPVIFKKTLYRFVRELQSVRLIYQQSDEVNVLFFPKRPNSQYSYGGKVYKLISLTASMLSTLFTEEVYNTLGILKPANFDARIILPDSEEDVIEYFKWRMQYAIRNSIIRFAKDCGYSKRIHGLTKWEIVKLLEQNGCSWSALPDDVKFGWFLYYNPEAGFESVVISGKDWIKQLEKMIKNSLTFIEKS